MRGSLKMLVLLAGVALLTEGSRFAPSQFATPQFATPQSTIVQTVASPAHAPAHAVETIPTRPTPPAALALPPLPAPAKASTPNWGAPPINPAASIKAALVDIGPLAAPRGSEPREAARPVGLQTPPPAESVAERRLLADGLIAANFVER